MRRKLDTRFPAARIKKIMQADEDIGKIALAVPLLVSKALELFLQDLCNRTYGITVQKGAKTVNSFHLKQCIQTCNVFDFLRETVGKVPDLGGSDGGPEDRSLPKKRKVTDDEETGSDEDIKKVKTHGTLQIQGSSKGRGRGRQMSRGRGNQTVGNELRAAQDSKNEDADAFRVVVEMPSIPVKLENSEENVLVSKNVEAPIRNFDLNVGLDENGDASTALSGTSPNQSSAHPENDEYPGWSPAVVEKMGVDSIHLANFTEGVDEEDDDYDEEG